MSSRKEELFKKINKTYEDNLDNINYYYEKQKDSAYHREAANKLDIARYNKFIYDDYNEYIDIIKTEYENELSKIKILNDYIKDENLGLKEKYNKEYDFFKKKRNEYNEEKELLKTYNNVLIIILIILIYIISKYILFF